MPRGPFEPAHAVPSATVAVSEPPDAAVSAADATVTPEATSIPFEAAPPDPGGKLPAAAAEKLDQIKDLLITAEAIGEANLDRHFERVSQRQRELIREFFDRAMPGRESES
jgi:Tat protein secretion system quality control protein TatD with DNase activity